MVRQVRQVRQGFQSLANSLSHLQMTFEEYAIFFILYITAASRLG